MKKLKADNLAMAFVMLIVCMSFMCVMFMQFKTVEETDITDIKNMREAELRKTMASWKTKYEEASATLEDTNKKIEEYNDKMEKNEETSELIDKELKESNIEVGKTDVEGEGVEITLRDGEYNVVGWYLMALINELRYAGAEAIAINDIRVTNSTAIVDLNNYTYIMVGEQRVTGPYVVKAIGNEAYLSSILSLKNSGFIDLYKDDIQIEMQTSKEMKRKIEIPKYNGEMTYKYLKIEEEKE